MCSRQCFKPDNSIMTDYCKTNVVLKWTITVRSVMVSGSYLTKYHPVEQWDYVNYAINVP